MKLIHKKTFKTPFIILFIFSLKITTLTIIVLFLGYNIDVFNCSYLIRSKKCPEPE
jgi:hypothetical protein